MRMAAFLHKQYRQTNRPSPLILQKPFLVGLLLAPTHIALTGGSDRSPANPKPKTASDLNPPFSATSGPPQPPTATELLLGDVFPRQSNGLVVSGDGNSPRTRLTRR